MTRESSTRPLKFPAAIVLRMNSISRVPIARLLPVPEILPGKIPEILSGFRKETGNEGRERWSP